MPVYKCSGGKYRIGGGKCMYTSRASAERAYTGYRAVSHIEIQIEYVKSVVKKLQNLKKGKKNEEKAN